VFNYGFGIFYWRDFDRLNLTRQAQRDNKKALLWISRAYTSKINMRNGKAGKALIINY
jgi:hypothetical protein